jgi:5-formyltetrahydrofolate cyclo-ligase
LQAIELANPVRPEKEQPQYSTIGLRSALSKKKTVMSKEEIRKSILQQRIFFQENPLYEEKSKLVSKNIKKYLSENNLLDKKIAIYSSVKGEVQIDLNEFAGCNIAYPRLLNTRKGIEIEFAEVHENTIFKRSKLGFLEPEENSFSVFPEVIITPGTVFDKELNRIGYGKGHYDIYFKKLKKLEHNYFAIGCAFDFQVYEKISTQKHDIKMDVVITESKVFSYEFI